jgi:hypothetical protein
MAQYLLAAEADQIQDFIFRASHLREVVGGSQLLTRFCQEVPELLGGTEDNIIIRDGGSFRIVFDDKEAAQGFGEHLAEVYRRTADGTLTVAEPVEITNGDFARASEIAEEKLREAKRWRRLVVETTPQLPYAALCVSCGVGLAVTYGKRHEDENPGYLCRACQTKASERDNKGFVQPFIQAVIGDNVESFKWHLRPEDVSCYDSRRYVAYLLADGNNLGKLFNQCNQEQMKKLSKAITRILRECLAEPTKQIRLKQGKPDAAPDVPVLPLILGGDDLFALLPAPWALDFALRFCRAFETKMGKMVEELKLKEKVPSPTICAVVVICKETYPYRLAHHAGESRLKYAKQVSKALAYETNKHLSVVDFEVILGSQMAEEPTESDFRPTLRPYWILPEDQPDIPAEANGWGIPIRRLIQQRWELKGLPNKRLAQLREHFNQPGSPDFDRKEWAQELKRLLSRISRDEPAGQVAKKALIQLGSSEEDRLYRVKRKTDQEIWYGHGLPDLLDAWNFAFDLDKERDEYEEV